jgi:hypothetical protein
MWEAHFAFHVCVACFLPELFRRFVVERAVRTLFVVLPPPVSQGIPLVDQSAEPACVESLVAQPPEEAFHVPVLHRTARLDVHQSDLPVFGPADHPLQGEFRPIIRAHVFGSAALGDRSFEHPRHAPGTTDSCV